MMSRVLHTKVKIKYVARKEKKKIQTKKQSNTVSSLNVGI